MKAMLMKRTGLGSGIEEVGTGTLQLPTGLLMHQRLLLMPYTHNETASKPMLAVTRSVGPREAQMLRMASFSFRVRKPTCTLLLDSS